MCKGFLFFAKVSIYGDYHIFRQSIYGDYQCVSAMEFITYDVLFEITKRLHINDALALCSVNKHFASIRNRGRLCVMRGQVKLHERKSRMYIKRYGPYIRNAIWERGLVRKILFKCLSNLTTLTLGYILGWLSNPIKPGLLPSSVTTLILGEMFNQYLIQDMLPPSLTILRFGKNYNSYIFKNVLPPSLRTLTFGYDFNQHLAVGSLPPSLTTLKLGHNFNKNLAVGLLPPSLTILKFGHDFNQPLAVGFLPPSLTTLKFGQRFNQPITFGSLPSSLTTLKFGHDFNQTLAVGVLPLLLTTFGSGYNSKQHPCIQCSDDAFGCFV